MTNVIYLDGADINSDGSLKDYVHKGAPSVVMVQGNFCGFCTKAKPAFEKFVQLSGGRGMTAQTDGNSSEQQAAKFSQMWGASGGVPAYVGFDAQGKPVKLHSGNRDENSLMEFLKSL